MKGQILIVDDNPIDIKIVSTAIKGQGFECVGFTNHIEAFDWLKNETPRLIFLDLQLAGISGFDLIPKIKSQPNIKDVPIIIISGKKQTVDVAKAIQLGANDYIVKPLDPLVIQEKVRKLDEKTSSDFTLIELSESQKLNVFMARPVSILAMSEFGLKLMSNLKIEVGETIQLSSLPTELFGKDQIIARCLTCDMNQNQKSYVVQLTFVGITEQQRQVLRKACRQLWIQSRSENK